jgi:hypothetical protein
MANAKFNYPPRCRREWRKSKPASSFLAISSRSYRTLRSSASQQTPVPAFGSVSPLFWATAPPPSQETCCGTRRARIQ